LGVAVSSRLLLGNWRSSESGECTASSQDMCDRMKVVNKIAVAGLVATWAYGVVDALLNYKTEEPGGPRAANARTFALSILPTGAALRVSF
jgi:hypothetical protein